jgi:hypothetical protein
VKTMLNTKKFFFMLSCLIVCNTNLQAGGCHSHQPKVDTSHRPKINGEARQYYEDSCTEDRRSGDPDVLRETDRSPSFKYRRRILSKTSVGSAAEVSDISSLVHSRTTSEGSSRASSYDFDRQKIAAARQSLSTTTP